MRPHTFALGRSGQQASLDAALGRRTAWSTVLCAATLCACGDTGWPRFDAPFGSATARLRFEDTSAGALAEYAPSTFQMKLIAAYIAQEMDEQGDNVGGTSMFYVNESCQDDLMHCDVSGGTAEDGAPIDKIVAQYFDFSPGVDVNAALNAQARPVAPGSYHYARIEFCKWNQGGADNVRWGGTFGEDVVADRELQRNACTMNSARMEPPLELADGEHAVITLAYDLTSAVVAADTTEGAPPYGDDCAEVNGRRYCFTLPQFVPQVGAE